MRQVRIYYDEFKLPRTVDFPYYEFEMSDEVYEAIIAGKYDKPFIEIPVWVSGETIYLNIDRIIEMRVGPKL